MPKRNKPIRDIVHNYIYVTPIEEVMIDNPKFQRLRYISQNSLAYLTYPSNGINRFTHSLGVMHNGGRMFKKALENAEAKDLEQFIKNCEKLILKFKDDIPELQNNTIEDVQEEWIDKYGNISGFNHLPNSTDDKKINLDTKQIAIINIIWQSVRLGCVLHDIGHFPYSHLYENAVEKYLHNRKAKKNTVSDDIVEEQKNKLYNSYEKQCKKIFTTLDIQYTNAGSHLPLHEMKGVDLLSSFFDATNQGSVHLSKLCVELGKAIFIINKDLHKSIQNINAKEKIVLNTILCLHTIISSEIDADRLDYCVRDAICSGTELGAIDTERIINSYKLIQEPNNEFIILLTNSGMSAIEEFFHQRYLLYKYIIFHHNVVRLNGVLEEIIKKLLEIVQKKDTTCPVYIILEKHNFFNTKKEEDKRELLSSYSFEFYDDYWLKATISDIYHSKINKEELSYLMQLIEIYLYRKLNYISSLWKRDVDINITVQNILKKLERKRYFGTCFEQDKNEHVIKMINQYLFGKANPNYNTFITKLTKKIESKGVHLLASICKPRIYSNNQKESLKIAEKDINNEYIEAYKISKYLSALKEQESSSINFRLAFVNKEIRKGEFTLHKQCVEVTENLLIELAFKKE